MTHNTRMKTHNRHTKTLRGARDNKTHNLKVCEIL